MRKGEESRKHGPPTLNLVSSEPRPRDVVIDSRSAGESVSVGGWPMTNGPPSGSENDRFIVSYMVMMMT